MVERVRVERGLARGNEATVVERAFNAYLLGRLLATAEASAGPAEHDAKRIACEELRSSRRVPSAA
jgi:hypothetical protein